MSILKRELYIEKAFDNYFSAPGRAMFQLNELTQLLKIQPRAPEIIHKIIDLTKTQNTIRIFKWLILINRLIMEFVIKSEDTLGIIERMDSVEENEFDQVLKNKLIKPYKLYLMKRCQFLPKKSQNLDKMYQLMNLIQTGTGFS